MSCKDCKFFVTARSAVHITDWGSCHRYPNMVNVHMTYWCGEFVSRPVAQEKEDASEHATNETPISRGAQSVPKRTPRKRKSVQSSVNEG